MKFWYRNSKVIITLIILFFPVGLFLMWKYAQWSSKIKWIITGLIVVVLFFPRSTNITPSKQALTQVEKGCIGPDGKRVDLIPKACEEFNKAWKNRQQTQKTSIPTQVPTPATKFTSESVIISKKITEKINKLVAEKYPNFEVTIWNKDSEFASEGEIPYEVILNGSFNKTASSCDAAKKAAYYMLETFYKDNDIRPTLSRIMITIPYYLRVSLGASDGVPMAQGSGFSGPTNFWTVVERAGLGEDENGEMKNRSWATFLTMCK